MSKLEITTNKIAERKTYLLNSKLDYSDARFIGETIKMSLFDRGILSKPKLRDISFLTSNKCYEPFFVVGGKYSLDYRKRNTYTFKVDNQTQKMRIGAEEFKSASSPNDRLSRFVGIVGEEYAHCENETYLVLDRMMREISPEELPLAPFVEETWSSYNSDLEFRKARISPESEVAFLRARLVKVPSNASEVIRENFEITQRLLVYKPVYELTFENVKSKEVATALIDGITGKVLLGRVLGKNSGKPARNFSKPGSNTSSTEKNSKIEARSSQSVPIPRALNKIINDARQENVPEKHATYSKVQFAFGCLSLVVGLLAANFSLFGWSTPAYSFYLLGDYARYACAYGGFGAIILGSMMVNDFIILRSRGFKSQSSAISLDETESEEEQVHFVVSEFEEENEYVSQISSKQKR